jgi:hypothetical protein
MVVYYDNTVPSNTIEQLKLNGVEVIEMSQDIFGCFWRFLISDRHDCEYAIFRDADSRINSREKFAVDDWILSNKSIHVMRDHPYHGIPAGNDRLGILAGMWGIKGNVIPITDMVKKFIKNKSNVYGIDQSFLKSIFMIFENDNLTHDEFFVKNNFPSTRNNQRFIGERIDENEKPLTEDWKLIKI